MSEQPNPIMAMVLEHQSFLGQAELVENEIMPIQEQLDFGPGDAAILATSNVPLERDFTVVRAVDPEKYAHIWPDWEERVGPLHSHVLCEYFSQLDPEITLGWFSRLKLLPISNYRYREARRWLKQGFPEDHPEWVKKCYHKYTEALAERAPDRVPVALICSNCGKREVVLKIVRILTYTCRVGRVIVEDQERYVPVNDLDEESKHIAILQCTNCNEQSGPLDDDEWILPGLSN